jgi:hypothetical protein
MVGNTNVPRTLVYRRDRTRGTWLRHASRVPAELHIWYS